MAKKAKAHKKKILVVDDEPDICRFISRYLSPRGFDVEEAHDGQQGLEAVKKRRPDLIILDVVMPKINGFDLLKYLKAEPGYSDIPVIMLTVKNEPKNLDKGVRLGSDFYLPKPFSVKNLIGFIKLALNE